jgi:hypothetical protein
MADTFAALLSFHPVCIPIPDGLAEGENRVQLILRAIYSYSTNNERSDGLGCMGMDGQIKWKTGEAPFFIEAAQSLPMVCC